jgi:hypothetical protein
MGSKSKDVSLVSELLLIKQLSVSHYAGMMYKPFIRIGAGQAATVSSLDLPIGFPHELPFNYPVTFDLLLSSPGSLEYIAGMWAGFFQPRPALSKPTLPTVDLQDVSGLLSQFD